MEGSRVSKKQAVLRQETKGKKKVLIQLKKEKTIRNTKTDL